VTSDTTSPWLRRFLKCAVESKLRYAFPVFQLELYVCEEFNVYAYH
jgi:hypothetical protein